MSVVVDGDGVTGWPGAEDDGVDAQRGALQQDGGEANPVGGRRRLGDDQYRRPRSTPLVVVTVATGCGGVRVVGGAAAGQDFLIETVERLGEVADDRQPRNGVGGYRLVGQQQGHRGGGGDDRAGPRGAGWWVGGERVEEDGPGRGGSAWADESGPDGVPVVRPPHHGVGRGVGRVGGSIGWCGPFERGRTASSASGDGERPTGNARAVMSRGDLSTLGGGDAAGSGGGCSAVPTVPVCGLDAAAVDAAVHAASDVAVPGRRWRRPATQPTPAPRAVAPRATSTSGHADPPSRAVRAAAPRGGSVGALLRRGCGRCRSACWRAVVRTGSRRCPARPGNGGRTRSCVDRWEAQPPSGQDQPRVGQRTSVALAAAFVEVEDVAPPAGITERSAGDGPQRVTGV